MMKFVLKNPCQQFCIELFPRHFHGFMSGGKPVQSTRFCPCMSHCPTFEHRLTSLGHTVFWHKSETLRQLFARFPIRPACCLAPSQRSSLPSYLNRFLPLQHAVSLRLTKDLRKLSARIPIRPSWYLSASKRRSPAFGKLFDQSCYRLTSLGSTFVETIAIVETIAMMTYVPKKARQHLCIQRPTGHFRDSNAVSPPGQLFPRFPVSPACCLAPSQQCSPQAICMVSHPSSMLPEKLSASYFQGFLSVHHALSQPPSEAPRKLFGRVPVRPACCLAPSQQCSPEAICAISCPSSILSGSLPAMLSGSCLRRFLSLQHPVSLPPSMLSASYLHGSLAPSQRNSPPSFLHGVSSVQHAVSLPPSEAFGKPTAQFPVRPACCLAPPTENPPKAISTVCYSGPACYLALSQQSSPRAICTVSYPYSMLSRSPPAKLSASYLGRFLSVQHAASLPPSKALRELFARFLPIQQSRLAPFQPSSLQAVSTVSSPSSMLSRSLPAKLSTAICGVSYPSSILSRSLPAQLSAGYAHGFLPELSARYLQGVPPVQHAVSLPPRKSFRKLLARFLVRPACCLAPSHQSSPQAISTISIGHRIGIRSLYPKI